MTMQRLKVRAQAAPGRVLMEIDASILDELVGAGLGNDHLSVVKNALLFSQFLERFMDQNGNVYIQNPSKSMDQSDGLVAVHAFERNP